jgi:adenylyltransferase/sulfurtransferase
VIKNLALLGIGNLASADMDRIEESNLSRSVLFRKSDEGKSKADVAAGVAREIYPDLRAISAEWKCARGSGIGLVSLGECRCRRAGQSRGEVICEQRVRAGRPAVDRWRDRCATGDCARFCAAADACYECAMGEADWRC